MSHYTTSYTDRPRWQADDKVIDDIREYVGKKAFSVLREEADKVNTPEELRGLQMAMIFTGIRGYPVHAFARRYCLTAYREWMHDGEDAVQTDAHGFQLEGGK